MSNSFRVVPGHDSLDIAASNPVMLIGVFASIRLKTSCGICVEDQFQKTIHQRCRCLLALGVLTIAGAIAGSQ
jgi:hypothetical protein